MTAREILLSLAIAGKIRGAELVLLLDHFRNLYDILDADLRHLLSIEGIDRRAACNIRSTCSAIKRLPPREKLYPLCYRDDSVVTLIDPEYPSILRNIYNPPPFLFAEGTHALDIARTLAVVGTRKPTLYGRRIARMLGEFCAKCGITTVSGVARGIDSEVHRATIEAGGTTVGVLGCGRNVVYPSENEELYGSIRRNGLLITEFPPHTPPLKQNFPARNRIVSGISQAVVVIEAGRKSGALITAAFGLEQGKTIFCLPGRIDEENTAGINELIRDGAIPLFDFSDILTEVRSFHDLHPSGTEEDSPRHLVPVNRKEGAVLELLGSERRHFNELCRLGEYSVEEMSGLLFSLEMNQLVTRIPGNYYVKN
jgi:DNA processing protein